MKIEINWKPFTGKLDVNDGQGYMKRIHFVKLSTAATFRSVSLYSLYYKKNLEKSIKRMLKVSMLYRYIVHKTGVGSTLACPTMIFDVGPLLGQCWYDDA